MRKIGRYYQFTKKITAEEAEMILKEMKALDDIKSVSITEDLKLMKVETNDYEFAEVMHKAVNICRRLAGGCEVEFSRFAYND